MTKGKSFWDDIEPSSETTPEHKLPQEPETNEPSSETTPEHKLPQEPEIIEPSSETDYVARAPKELSVRVIPFGVLLMFLLPILLFSLPFTLSQDYTGCFGSFEYMEDGELHCVEGDTFQADYTFSENHVTISSYFGEDIRWEQIGEGGVLGYAYLDSNFDDINAWYAYNLCEWEAGNELGDELWYCTSDKEKRSESEYVQSYCEFQDVHWYCTDSFGQNPSHSDTSNETRAGVEVQSLWTYSCVKVVPFNPSDNTSINRFIEIEAGIILPAWCFTSPVFAVNESIEQVLPFNGTAVYLYPMYSYEDSTEYGSIERIQYTSSSMSWQIVSIHTYNEDGSLTEEIEQSRTGIVVPILFYSTVIVLFYALSTKKTHIEHLGTENTLVVSKSWLNKPRKIKKTISLDSSSLLELYTSTHTSTDSDGHGSTTTSHHHKITHSGRPEDQLPNGFKTSELIKVTGLERPRDD